MQSLQINTGEIRLAVNNDPERVIVFNPADAMFAERFYNLIGEFQRKIIEYQAKAKQIETNTGVDDNGIPLNASDRIELVKDVCSYIREKIDIIFGAGTSQKAFGDAMELNALSQFFEGITPFVQKERAAKIETYTNKKPKRR